LLRGFVALLFELLHFKKRVATLFIELENFIDKGSAVTDLLVRQMLLYKIGIGAKEFNIMHRLRF
jgi:hypothetical protein